MPARPERHFVFEQLLNLLASLGAAALMTGCASITVGNGSSFTAISTSVSELRVNQTTQLSTHTQFDGTALTFYVNGIQGGNAQVGTISSTGLYTAPAIVPIPNSVMITSISAAHPDFPPVQPHWPSGIRFRLLPA